MKHAPFVHLHTHSEYSMLDGASKIDDLIDKARQFRMPAIALTDHGNMFGALEFYKKAVSKGVKPIIGEEFYIAPSSMKKKIPKEKPYHLILLAKDEDGYRNLLYLSSMAYLEGFYYKPRIDLDLLSSHANGLICMSACLGGEIPSLILKGDYSSAKKKAHDYIDVFSKDNFYLELMDNGLKEQDEVNKNLIRLSKEMDLKVVATNDIHYLEKGDAEYHDVLLCIQTGKTINEKKRLKFKTNEFYFRSPDEMITLFTSYPDAIKNSIEITEKCNLFLELDKYKLPNFPIPQGHTAEGYLKEIAEEGIKRRYKVIGEVERKRVDMELEVIKSMGFSTYFLIVWDFIRFAKSMDITVGPGRGSAAGSIIAYALGITNVDPLKYGLLFERFLNVSRISMPDIDIDFDGDRRDEVINYVRNKYGNNRVAQIITFGAMKARAVLRDVARAMDIPLKEVDAIAKMIPSRHNITIEEALDSSKDLYGIVKDNTKIKRLFEIAKRLEKLVRHPSTHAAGVVISPVPLTNIVPLYKDPKSGVISTQYQAKNLEDVGLIKMDFLGLKNLTVIRRCLKLIEKNGLKVPDMDRLDLEDEAVYKLLSSGNSKGVFQLESSGMQNLLKMLVPDKFDDLVAVLALYRPGPLDSGMVDEFIERKNGKKPILYPHPSLKDVLKKTYGVILYQEQVMEIARVIGGFTMAEADNLRKAMGKKKPEILEEAKEQFIEGAVKRKIERRIAEEIFEMVKTFGRYGFNKSHSTAYAILAFQTAYLKTHYSVYYFASLLSGELNNTDKIAQYLNDARKMNIEILPPDINKSGAIFEVEDNGIRYALSAIKNVGESAAISIVQERQKGNFTSMDNLVARVDLRLVNRRVFESLIKSGAIDNFNENRRTLFENIDKLLEYGSSLQKDKIKGQNNLFDESEVENITSTFLNIKSYEEWNQAEVSEFEKEAMGFYFKAHPLLKYTDMIEKYQCINISELKGLVPESTVNIFVIVVSSKKITTKNNKQMAFLRVEDLTGIIEVVVFPGVYEKFNRYLQSNKVIFLVGKSNGEKIIADKIMFPEELDKFKASQLHIKMGSEISEEKLLRLRDLFIQNKGSCNIYIHVLELEKNNMSIKASPFLLVEPKKELISKLKEEELVEKVWVS